MNAIDALKIVTGSKLSYRDEHGNIVVRTVATREETQISPNQESFLIKFRDNNGQECVVTELTPELKCLNMPERYKTLPVIQDELLPLSKNSYYKDIPYTKSELLVKKLMDNGLSKQILIKSAKDLAMELSGKDDELELFCWRLYGKYSLDEI